MSGAISYDIYLFHLVVFAIVLQKIPQGHIGAAFALYVAALLLICAFIRTQFENPILAARPKYDRSHGKKTLPAGRPNAIAQGE